MTDDFNNDFNSNDGEGYSPSYESLSQEPFSPLSTEEKEADILPDQTGITDREETAAPPAEDPYDNPYIQTRPKVIEEPAAVQPVQSQQVIEYAPESYAESSDDNNKKEKKISSKVAPFIAGVAVTLAVCLIAVSVTSIFRGRGLKNQSSTGNTENNPEASSISINNTPKTDTSIKNYDEALTPAQVAAKVKPSVVSIITYDTSSMFSQNQSQGSGIIYSADGYIITNSHVIGDTANNRVTVILPETEKEYEAKVLGYDTTTDLAVLKINEKNLIPAEFGNSDSLVTGDMVLAVGNPGGVLLAGSVSVGYVSGVNRVIDGDGTSTSAMKYIQTDAAINPGNSGGALVNMYGEVIGVNTVKIAGSDYEGLGFAIPVTTVQPIIKDLSSVGYVTGRVKLGISCYEIGETMARYYGVPTGIYVQVIDPDSDLNGKVIIGDIITKINGKEVSSVADVQDITTGMSEGQKVKLTVYRAKTYYNDATTFNVDVKLIADKGTTASNNAQDSGNNNNNGNNNGNGNGYGYGNGFSFDDFFNSIF